MAVLPWLHTRNAPIALVIGLAVAWTLWRRRATRALVAWLVPLSVGALSWLAFFKIVYGAFDPSAPYGGYTQSGPGNIPRGITGLLFDQQFGLLAYAPALALGIVGIVVMLRRHRDVPEGAAQGTPSVSPAMMALVLVAVAVPYAGLAASYVMWWGGASAPARFLTPIVLPLAIPAAVAWHRWRSRASRAAMLGLIVLSAVVLVALLTVQRGTLAFNSRDGFAVVADWASPVADLSQALPALHRDTLDVALWQTLAWACVPLASLVAGLAMSRRGRTSRGAVALGMLVTAVVASSGAAHLAWSMRGVRGVRPDASQVRLTDALGDPMARALAVVYRGAPRNDGFGRLERTTKQIAFDELVGRLSFSTSLRRAPRGSAFAAGALPAGRYRLRVATRNAAAGGLDVAIGREGPPCGRWTGASTKVAATATAEFDLVVPVQLVTVRGPAEAVQAVTEVILQPVQVRHRDRATRPRERRARRGRWCLRHLPAVGCCSMSSATGCGSGHRPTCRCWLPVRVRRPAGPLRLFLRNGPFENQVTLTGDSTQSLTLAPNEERTVALDVTWIEGAARVVIRASRGFRPLEVDKASTDPRLLGVWLSFP